MSFLFSIFLSCACPQLTYPCALEHFGPSSWILSPVTASSGVSDEEESSIMSFELSVQLDGQSTIHTRSISVDNLKKMGMDNINSAPSTLEFEASTIFGRSSRSSTISSEQVTRKNSLKVNTLNPICLTSQKIHTCCNEVDWLSMPKP